MGTLTSLTLIGKADAREERIITRVLYIYFIY
jgi:hypothetical protein